MNTAVIQSYGSKKEGDNFHSVLAGRRESSLRKGWHSNQVLKLSFQNGNRQDFKVYFVPGPMCDAPAICCHHESFAFIQFIISTECRVTETLWEAILHMRFSFSGLKYFQNVPF